jgi:hypothetical protein
MPFAALHKIVFLADVSLKELALVLLLLSLRTCEVRARLTRLRPGRQLIRFQSVS